ncbi:MarR family winged helix-turn-helix transcriptional regulator [Lentilactobacillus sp. Marseille-Q4993]|uniref:MarR family winged helix-turn-helix transcriptional regulator n=1 Tax=Lentilactobacillus sp. Marseille-Q4993 TaxID=3039492 RepID=UPI0024BC215B|nr:MarR family winged helix-turn-helix transcriptional regulator [Lentilactobacillus sp. Marseille-Q4993]
MNHSIGIEVKRLNNDLSRFSAEEAKQFGITPVQMSIIDFLYRNEEKQELFQTDIEREFNIQKSSTTAILKLMEKKDLIVRVISSHDSRFKRILLTPKARMLGEKIRAVFDQNESNLREVLGDNVDEFLGMIKQLQDYLKKGK